jgi:UDP-4-amino-4,6-dideoxy-N-acetyl-beta-L-altrosamine transaminase
MIPYGKHDISKEDIDAVIHVLKSDFITQGPTVEKFERVVSEFCKANYGIATNSATSALHIACLSIGLGKGDYLWTSTITFVASANCGLYCNANIDFVDIDPKTYNISSKALEEKLIQARQDNKLPKVVIPVHFAGQPCEMKKIYQLSQEYGFKIIEDASHSIGGEYKGQPVGNCKYSDITIFSFHPVKIITTGEGGMALTNSATLAKKMLLLRSHGVTRDQELIANENEGPWFYQQIELGYNYRMTDIQAALGISQMKRLNEFINNRHKIKQRYDKKLSNMPVVIPYQSENSYSALHLYPIQIRCNSLKKTHEQIFKEMRENNIGVNLHYIPVHTQPYYQNMGFKKGDYPNAEHYYSRAMSLPIFNTMTTMQQDEVIAVLAKVLE